MNIKTYNKNIIPYLNVLPVIILKTYLYFPHRCSKAKKTLKSLTTRFTGHIGELMSRLVDLNEARLTTCVLMDPASTSWSSNTHFHEVTPLIECCKSKSRWNKYCIPLHHINISISTSHVHSYLPNPWSSIGSLDHCISTMSQFIVPIHNR